MGRASNIEWTTHTWNPWHGCTHVSEGCDHCYMFTQKRAYGQNPELVVRSKTKFQDPLTWPKQPAYVFTCSWSDFFHVTADEWRPEAWEIIRRTPWLTYQILTKRHGRIRRCLPPDWGAGYPNVWLGVSAETQEWANRRVTELLTIPALVHWVSAEPLLGPLQMRMEWAGLLDWVVLGGESGPGHRPMAVEWAEELAASCSVIDAAVFVKQDSGSKPGQQGRLPVELWNRKEFPVPA